jgi:hypothetical protein
MVTGETGEHVQAAYIFSQAVKKSGPSNETTF